jgi:iron complex transport system ATP-binding protein
MLQVNLPHYTIDGKVILQDITFTLQKGENLTILGANGAGKSTLAKILCGLYRSKKRVKVEDRYVETLDAHRRGKKLNYIPPKLSMYDRYLKVKDFLQLSRYHATLQEEHLLATLEKLHLKGFEERFCTTLSSGEQQLLLLASACMHKADITIFDEPTANLDPKKIKTVFSLMHDENLPQKIVITHDLQFAYKLGYAVLYIDEGRGCFYHKAEHFFCDENLEKLYDGAVKQQCGSVMVTL